METKSGKFSYCVCGTLNKKGTGSCPAKYLNVPKFDRLIIDKLKERILTPENLMQLVELANAEIDGASRSHHEERDLLLSEVAETGRRLEKGVLPIVRYGGRYWARTSDLCDVNAML
jgi:site-specific DNA recombinase